MIGKHTIGALLEKVFLQSDYLAPIQNNNSIQFNSIHVHLRANLIIIIITIIIIRFFIIYVPSQQLQGQLQTQHSVGTGNYIMDKHNIKLKTNHTKLLAEEHINEESKQTNKDER
jgi:hypothetical protein